MKRIITFLFLCTMCLCAFSLFKKSYEDKEIIIMPQELHSASCFENEAEHEVIECDNSENINVCEIIELISFEEKELSFILPEFEASHWFVEFRVQSPRSNTNEIL